MPDTSYPVTIIGLDPGLRHTGWGIIRTSRNSISYIAAGRISPKHSLAMAERLALLSHNLAAVIKQHAPQDAAVEKTFVNRNPESALLLGQARGVVMVTAALGGLAVAEYASTSIKKTVTGQGHAGKDQVSSMVNILIKGVGDDLAVDAFDALAVAICHARYKYNC